MFRKLSDKIVYLWFLLANNSIFFYLLACSPTTAQILPDTTSPVKSSVSPDGNTSIIDGGTRAGSNLFHSFNQFSVPTGSAAYFNNALDVQNIITRITGGSASNIDGLIRANGTANLFILNPNGIIFGSNASLNIGGSFVASTASSLNFSDGNQFSSTAPQITPLLTMSVPIGLQFGSNPGVIRVQGTGYSLSLSNPVFSPFRRGSSSAGLQVNLGKTLALVGGDIELEGGTLKTAGGRIELGSVAGPSMVRLISIDKGYYIDYESVPTFGNIQLKHQSAIDASGVASGSIQVQGANVKLADGSVILIQNQGSQVGGNINVNASESLEVNGISSNKTVSTSLINETVKGGIGGNIGISTKRLVVQDGAAVSTKTFSSARGGELIVNAPESIQVIGFSPVAPSVFSLIATGTLGSGNAGDITVNTEQLTARNGGNVGSVTLGAGNGGNLKVDATEVELTGVAPTSISSALFASTGGTGSAGKLAVTASRVTVKDGAVISSSTAASGNSGSITIKASDLVEVSGSSSILPTYSSTIVSAADIQSSFLQQSFGLPSKPTGASGDVTISTRQLRVANRGQVDVRNEGPGNGGSLVVNADSIVMNNSAQLLAATVSGKGGNIILRSHSLQLRHDSLITATAIGSGNGGSLRINTDTLVALENSNITAKAAQGRGGDIQISTQGLFLSPDSRTSVFSAAGPQFNGTVKTNTPDTNPERGLATLPVQPVDVTSLIAQSCPVGARSNKFIITGRGGLPENPNNMLSSDTAIQDWRSPAVNSSGRQQVREHRSSRSISMNSTTSEGAPIVEAQGWIVDTKGEVFLTAPEPTAMTIPWVNSSANCNAT